MKRALLFDYDGLLVDTETVEYHSWKKVFEDHGQDLPPEDWIHVIGGVEMADFKVVLEEKLGKPILEWDEVHQNRLEHHRAMMETKDLLPGALSLMQQGKERGYRIGVVSSSPGWWVEKGLNRFALAPFVETLRVRENCLQHKPHPFPYAAALEDLGAQASMSFGFEDSEKGVTAGKAAGLTMIAVPNALTKLHDLSAADYIHTSLEEFKFQNI